MKRFSISRKGILSAAIAGVMSFALTGPVSTASTAAPPTSDQSAQKPMSTPSDYSQYSQDNQRGSDQSNTGQSKNGDKSDFKAVYDVAPAMAKAALASSEYDNAYANFIATTHSVRSQFMASDDYLKAVRAVNDARSAYDSAVEPVLTKLNNDQKYQQAVEQRNQLQKEMDRNYYPPDEKLALADQKMQLGAEATRMESAAIQNDSNARDAKAKLYKAQSDLQNMIDQFDANLSGNQKIVAAKKELDTAQASLAAANAYLHGAWIARNDTVAADQRRYPTQPNYISYPYNYGFGGNYFGNGGYYGVGGGYYGLNVGIIRN